MQKTKVLSLLFSLIVLIVAYLVFVLLIGGLMTGLSANASMTDLNYIVWVVTPVIAAILIAIWAYKPISKRVEKQFSN